MASTKVKTSYDSKLDEAHNYLETQKNSRISIISQAEWRAKCETNELVTVDISVTSQKDDERNKWTSNNRPVYYEPESEGRSTWSGNNTRK